MNFVKELKQRELDERLEKNAIMFHGHDGPFMTIGLRMGLAALEMLDCKGWFDLECEARLTWCPPDSCVIDGIQSSTGCTMGKKNITVVEQPGLEALFNSKGRSIKIALKPEVLDRIRSELKGDDVNKLNLKLRHANLSELFDMEILV